MYMSVKWQEIITEMLEATDCNNKQNGVKHV